MAYTTKNNLISRAGYSGVGDIWDTITGAAGAVVKAYGSEQAAAGAAAQQNRDLPQHRRVLARGHRHHHDPGRGRCRRVPHPTQESHLR